MTDKQVRSRYTQEFRLQAVRQVQVGQAQSVVDKVLGVPNATLGKWVRQVQTAPSRVLSRKTHPVTPE